MKMESAQRSYSLADRLLQVLEQRQQFSGNERTTSESTNGTTDDSNDGSPTATADSSNTTLNPLVIEEDLRPDAATAQLGPADHTTITPLHWASNLGHDDCVRYLLMAGWNVRALVFNLFIYFY